MLFTSANSSPVRLRYLAAFGALCAVIISMGIAAAQPTDEANPVVTSLKRLHDAGPWDLHHRRPLAVDGTVTFVDPARGRLVLQDSEAAAAFRCSVDLAGLRVGSRVHVTASAIYPVIASVPGFPFRPAQTQIIKSLQIAPTKRLDYVERLQAFVVPPVSGSYRFWISSDDSSELWLSPDGEREHARRIAAVPLWTDESEWTRFRTQRSEPVELNQGERYYIEILHEQADGDDHVAVAWQSPTQPREVIGQEYLTPYGAENSAGPRRGVLREVWTSSVIASPADLQPTARTTTEVELADAKIEVMGAAPLPSPLPLRAGEPITTTDNFRWAEIVAEVRSTHRTTDDFEIELGDGERRLVAHLQDLSHGEPPDDRGYLVRLLGVVETAFDPTGDTIPGALWIPRREAFSVVGPSPTWNQLTVAPLKDLANVTPRSDEDVPVRVKGRVLSQSSARDFVLQEEGGFSGFTSNDGKTWQPLGEEIAVPMHDKVYVGLAVSSNGLERAVATFDHVMGIGAHAEGNQVGNPPRSGGFSREADAFTVTGFGHDIWEWEDEFYFVHDMLEGDGEIVAHINPFEFHSVWAKVGLMIRDSLAIDAPFVDLVNVGQKHVSLQWRVNNPYRSTEAIYTPDNVVPSWLKLVRQRRTIRVATVQNTTLRPGQPVEALGFLRRTASGIEIVRGFARATESPPAAMAEEDRPLIEVRSLLAQGKSSLPNHFRLRGVVTCNTPSGGGRYFAVQDASGGSFLYDNNQADWQLIRPGTLVDVYCDPITVDTPTGIVATRVVRIGPAVMPTPLRHPTELTKPAKGEGQWIALEGIVYAPATGNAAIVRTAGSNIRVEVMGMNHDDWAQFVDRKISIRGVAAYKRTSDMTVLVPGKEYTEPVAEVVAASPPVRKIADLAAGRMIGDPAHRVRIVGTLTFVHDHLALIDDGSGAASIQLVAANETIQPGDKVEALGFPVATRTGTQQLVYAEVRKVGVGALPAPVSARAAAVFTGSLGQRRVALVADVIAKDGTGTETWFDLQAEGRKFRAWCPTHSAALEAIPPASRVRVTGFALLDAPAPTVEVDRSNSQRTPLFVVASANDFTVLQAPPWWSLRRALYGLGALGAVLIIVLAWAQVLRHRVRQRTQQLNAAMQELREETERAATLTERQRLAGEIHDSLEQGITGIMLQLEGALQSPTCPPDVREIVAVARNMVSFSHAEIRHAIWDLHSPVLEGASLKSALQEMVQRLGRQSPAVDVTTSGTPVELSPETEHHMLRIAQEAVTNALKHARATTIKIGLQYSPDTVILRIEDDGCGFSTENLLVDSTHFGLRSLRRRARKMNATLNLSSRPSGGTVVEVVVPVRRDAVGG